MTEYAEEVPFEVGDKVIIDSFDFGKDSRMKHVRNAEALVVKKYKHSAILKPLDKRAKETVSVLGGNGQICVAYKNIRLLNSKPIEKVASELTEKQSVVIEYYSAHKDSSVKQICDALEVSASTVRSAMKAAGIDSFSFGAIYSRDVKSKIKYITRLHHDGYSLSQIEKSIGLRDGALHDYARNHQDLRVALNS